MAAKKKNESITEEVKNSEQKFSKEQIVTSKKYESRRDLLNALLIDGETYTVETVEQMIEKYMKGQVK